jgi:hypothetical protein
MVSIIHGPPRLHHLSVRFSKTARTKVALSMDEVSRPRDTTPRGLKTSSIDKATLVRAVS